MAVFPRPYLNDAKQDDTILHYPRGGDFSATDIGSRKSGMPKDIKSETMDLDHVGSQIPGPTWGGK
jgi:hypothetical protein